MDIQTILQIFSIIIVPACSAIIVFLSWYNNRKTEQLKILHQQLNEKKHVAYAKAVEMFYNVLKESRNNKKTNFQKKADEMTDIKRDVFMYGSDEVFLAFNRWLIHSVSQNGIDQKHQFEDFLHFMLEIRKDLCGGNTSITERDILINLTQSETEANNLMSNNILNNS